MNAPVTYDFPDHYQNDGFSEFTLTLTYADGSPVDLSGSRVKMALVQAGQTGFVFDSQDGSLAILPNGVIRFNKMNSWEVAAGRYTYDLQVIFASGFIRTYVRGTWTVTPDITK